MNDYASLLEELQDVPKDPELKRLSTSNKTFTCLVCESYGKNVIVAAGKFHLHKQRQNISKKKKMKYQ